jgi:hypothetical protein
MDPVAIAQDAAFGQSLAAILFTVICVVFAYVYGERDDEPRKDRL